MVQGPKGYGELPDELLNQGAITRKEVMEKIGMNPVSGHQIALLRKEYGTIFNWKESSNGIEYTTNDRVSAFFALHPDGYKKDSIPKNVSGEEKKSPQKNYELQEGDMYFQDFVAQINELKPEGLPLSQAALGNAVKKGHKNLPDYITAEKVRTSSTPAGRMLVVHGGAKYIASLKGEKIPELDLSEQASQVIQESVGETSLIPHSPKGLAIYAVQELKKGNIIDDQGLMKLKIPIDENVSSTFELDLIAQLANYFEKAGIFYSQVGKDITEAREGLKKNDLDRDT